MKGLKFLIILGSLGALTFGVDRMKGIPSTRTFGAFTTFTLIKKA